MKKIFIALFLLNLLFSVFSQSLFDDSKNLYDDNLNISLDENSLFLEDKSLFNENKNLVQNDKLFFNIEKNIIPDDGIGVYEKSVEKGIENSAENGYEENTISVVEDKYIGNYGKFLDVTSDNLEARKQFVSYFTDWQRLGMSDDFFEYAGNRAEQEKQIEYCYDAALLKFGIGTCIVATTWIVAFTVPGGTIYQAAVLIIAKSTTVAAVSGGAIGGITSAGIGLLQGKTDDELVYYAVNGAADGYLIGAITGLVQGSGEVYKLSKEATKLKDFSGVRTIFDNKVYDANGKYLGKYIGNVKEINGRAIINQSLVNQNSNYGIPYRYCLADDGNGKFFKIVNPDFTNVKIVEKVYKPPRNLWNNSEAAKAWCRNEYKKDLASPDVKKILGISKKEASMRLQFENRFNLRDPVFMKKNKLSEKQINEFLSRYDTGAWHHMPESGELIYVPKNHNVLAPHTGGDSFWGEKLRSISKENIEW